MIIARNLWPTASPSCGLSVLPDSSDLPLFVRLFVRHLFFSIFNLFLAFFPLSLNLSEQLVLADSDNSKKKKKLRKGVGFRMGQQDGGEAC